VLRFSYDGLDEVEEAAFLDASGFYGASGIHVLQQKALITISSDNIIQMHDLIREMGCKIVLKNLLNVQEDAVD